MSDTLSKEEIDQLSLGAEAKLGQGRIKEAVAMYRIVLENRPGDVPAMNNMGWAFWK